MLGLIFFAAIFLSFTLCLSAFSLVLELTQVLKLAQNELQQLPSSLLLLEHLRVFNLKNNRLQSLPTPFRFAKLATLSVQGNALQHLPEGLLDCLHLQILRLKGNPLLHLKDGASLLATRLPKLRLLELDEPLS